MRARARAQVENFALSACYCGLVLGYGWQTRVLGLGRGDAAHDFWFPFGAQSLRFVLIALGSDLLEDLAAHVLVAWASQRHPVHCHFTSVFPGWLKRPAHPVRCAGVVLWVPATLTSFAFALRELGLLAGGGPEDGA